MGEMMGKRQIELTAMAVAQIKRRGINFVGGVAGLGLNVCASGGRSWILRYQIGGKRRDKGLGGFPDVTLAQSKELARAARTLIAQGIDPVNHGRMTRAKLVADQASSLTFSKAATQYIDANEASWKNAKHVQQWRNTIETYANPVIGKMYVQNIGLVDVLAILEPIWHTKTETAKRLQGRIETIFDWASAKGLRLQSNPAQWRGHLDKLLPSPQKITKRKHHPALPFPELPAFMKLLSTQTGMGARALEFTILTGARSGEVRFATWDEFDLESRVWTIPAARMKAKKEHRVPLSGAAIAIVEEQQKYMLCDYVFPSPRICSRSDEGTHQSNGKRQSTHQKYTNTPQSDHRKRINSHLSDHKEYTNTPLSDMTLSGVLRRMKVDAVPHGFRSTFRDWIAEKTDYSNQVAEMALAHSIGSKVEAAYRRGDLFDKRISLMQDWANYAYSFAHRDENSDAQSVTL